MNCSTHTCEYCFKTCNIFCGCRGEREAIEREREKTAGFSYCRRCGMEKKTMFCKVAGLVVVLGVLVILYHYRKRLAWAAILGVSVFQFWLLWYLNAAGPSTIAKAKKYRLQHQKTIEALQFQPTPTPANPVF